MPGTDPTTGFSGLFYDAALVLAAMHSAVALCAQRDQILF